MAVDWAEVKSKLNHLKQLEDNWDSYGAKAINSHVCDNAYNILNKIARFDTPTPSVVPCAKDTIQFEWHLNGIDLEVEVSLDAIDVLYINGSKEEGFEVSCDLGINKLCRIIDECGDTGKFRLTEVI